jgi:peptide/nickel transport system ATP-binding protein
MSAFVEIKQLKKYFHTPRGTLHAVDDVTMRIGKGETMGVVGESGCGKSTLGRTVINLLEKTGGQVSFDGRDITSPSHGEMKKLRQELQIIFQDPYSSLNPRMTVEQTIMEPIRLHLKLGRREMEEKCERLMDMVGVDRRLRLSYPHELDGGRRQRVGIARALALDPKFIVCDEPVSALDVSIQAQILNLLMDLQEKIGLTYMFITHNMAVVRHVSHNISVMYLGNLVEESPTDDLFERPLHPYTKALLSAIPTTDIRRKPERILLKGEISSPINPKPGCRFAPRCAHAGAACLEPQKPEELAPGHFVACCRARELGGTRHG